MLEVNLEPCFVAKEVRNEIMKGIRKYPALELKLRPVLDALWLQELLVTEPDDLILFAKLKKRWGKEERNDGEAATLVLAKRYDLAAVIDEIIGRNAAGDYKVKCFGTVGVLARFAALEIVSRDDAWQLHEQMTNMPQDPYWSPVKSKQKFQEQVDYHIESLSLGKSII